VSVLRAAVLRRPATVLLTLLLTATLAAPALAQPSSDELRDDLAQVEERLHRIHMELAEVVEDYNEAEVGRETAEAELFVIQQEHGQLTEEVAALSELAEDHVRRIHKLGPGLELASVFVAGNPTDAGAKAATLRRVLAGQRADLEGLAAARTAVDAAEERLTAAHDAAAARAEEVAERRAAVEAMVADRQEEIAELEARIQEAERREEEARRRAEEERLRREAEERARQEAEEQARAQAAAAEAAVAREAEQAAAERERQAERAAATPAPSPSPTASPTASPTPAPTPTPTPTSEPAPSTRRSAQVAVDTALAQVGKPYQWGGSGPNSFDCSGLTSFAWRAAGVDITRTSRSQYAATTRISRGQLQPGDLIFYGRSVATISHVAMYIGGTNVVEAPYSGQNVRVRDGLSRSDIVGYGRP
jgi:peptidoglycan DL-endopeptidase CwlO